MSSRRSKNRGVGRADRAASPATVPGTRPSLFVAEALFFILIGVTIFLFLCVSFFPGESGTRFEFLFVSCFHPQGWIDLFWGSDLCEFSLSTLGRALVERVHILSLALVCIIAMCGAGSILLGRLTCWDTLGRWERLFLAAVAGLALWTGAISWLGWLGGAAMSLLIRFVTVAAALFGGVALVRFMPTKWSVTVKRDTNDVPFFGTFGTILLLFFMIFFVVLYLLGAMLPTCEYDMLEYHLQGAREFYETGRIGFSRHNVYMNMPLGLEMLYLWGMNLTGDVFTGALVGKTVVGSLALLTALGIGLFVYRLNAGRNCALLAAIVYLSFPMNFDVFANGLNDGLIGLTVIAIAFMLLIGTERPDKSLSLPLGLATGLAVSCKYTGIVFVLIPVLVVGAFLLVTGRIRHRCLSIMLFTLGFFVSGVAWYLKNVLATGNPFHPLLYQIFGDSTGTWTLAKNLRWSAAHSPGDFSLSTLGDRLVEWGVTSVMASPFVLLTLLAGLFYAIRIVFKRRDSVRTTLPVVLLTLFLLFYLLVWWLATHRISRFLVPILPVLATLFPLFCHGCFQKSESNRLPRTGWLLLIAIGYLLVVVPVFQTNYLLPYSFIQQDEARYGTVPVMFRRFPEKRTQGGPTTQTLLLVAQAQAFSYDSPILYSTCWDDSPLAALLENHVRYNEARTEVLEITDAASIGRNLLDHGIGWILFDGDEWTRFLQQGNYGITDPAINLRLFRMLQDHGILQLYPITEPVSGVRRSQNVRLYRVVPQGEHRN